MLAADAGDRQEEGAADMEKMDWDTLELACRSCTQCGLCATRHKVVFGVGNREAKLLFVGEGPGEQEDLQGIPFVGPSVNCLLESITCVKMSFSGSWANSCSRNAIRICLRNVIFPPESDLSLPAKILSNVDLPVPLGAMRAILSPSLMLKPICSKSTFGP